MTIEELKKLMPWIDVTEWVQHSNGGGWKHKTAVVPDNVVVPSTSTIGDEARIGYEARIGDEASIGYEARIGDEASIGARARIGARASIGDGASIGYGASIGPNYTKGVLCIQGSAHLITVCCPTDEVQIGCIRKSIDEWLDEFKTIGEENDYTQAQIEEYGALLQAVKVWITQLQGDNK